MGCFNPDSGDRTSRSDHISPSYPPIAVISPKTREETVQLVHTRGSNARRPLTQGGHDWGNVKVERASERLLTPGEVASLFRVDPKTVTRWAASGRISSIRTPGGHRRFRESEVRALLLGEPSESTP